MWWAVRIL